MKVPSEDRHLHTKSEFLDDIAMTLGGIAAERLVFNETSTGPSNDLKVATNLARRLVTSYGMSDDLGPMTFGDPHEMVFLGRDLAEQRNYSEEVASKIDVEVSKIMKHGYDVAYGLLVAHREKLNEIAKVLIEQETIEQEQFAKMVADVVPAGKAQPMAEVA